MSKYTPHFLSTLCCGKIKFKYRVRHKTAITLYFYRDVYRVAPLLFRFFCLLERLLLLRSSSEIIFHCSFSILLVELRHIGWCVHTSPTTSILVTVQFFLSSTVRIIPVFSLVVSVLSHTLMVILSTSILIGCLGNLALFSLISSDIILMFRCSSSLDRRSRLSHPLSRPSVYLRTFLLKLITEKYSVRFVVLNFKWS